MKSRMVVLTLMAGVSLAACAQEGSKEYAGGEIAVQASRVAAADAAPASIAPPPPSPGPGGEPANAGVMLAYSYAMGIEAPKEAIAPLVTAHEEACANAGTSVCQVMGSSVNAYGDDQVSGYLNLRAEPKWLEKFRATIGGDAQRAGGEVTANSVSTEDLTQYIIDTDARLQAKLALRERIRKLLESREGTLNDVLQAERALADVQGEIDSMTAQLGAAKARVAMSALSISYASDPETSTSMWKPLSEAFKSFGRTSMASLAAAVTFIARTWPFFILGLAVLAVLRIWLRGRRRQA